MEPLPWALKYMYGERFEREIIKAIGGERFQIQPASTQITRYMRFHVLVDMLVNQHVAFSRPSSMWDVRDGIPSDQLMSFELRDLLLTIGDKSLPPTPDNLAPEQHSELSRILRDATAISCWTEANDSYSLWKAFSDLDFGVCIVLTKGRALAWATEHDLDYGPVEYVRTKLDIEYFLDAILSTAKSTDAIPARRPLAWFKSQFFKAEEEFRFAKRMSPDELVESWKLRGAKPPSPALIPFDPVQWFGPSTTEKEPACHIFVAPQAPCWYLNLVRKTVRRLLPNSLSGLNECDLVRQTPIGMDLMGRCDPKPDTSA